MKKAERAANILEGTILKVLSSRQWYFDRAEYEIMEVIPTGAEGKFPMFRIEERGKERYVSHAFFSIPNIKTERRNMYNDRRIVDGKPGEIFPFTRGYVKGYSVKKNGGK